MKRKASPKKASVRGFQPALPLPGGGGGLPSFPPMQPGTMPPSGGGVLPQLQGINLQNILVQRSRPGAYLILQSYLYCVKRKTAVNV